MKILSRKFIASIYVLVGFGIFFLGIYIPNISSSLQLNNNKLLLTGKWQASEIYTDEMGRYEVRKTIEFVGPNKIIYNQFILRNSRIQSIEYYNLLFRYQLISENKLDLNARVSDKWEITTTKQNLIVSGASFVGNGEYKRVVSVNWNVIAISIVFFVFWAFHIIYHAYLNKKQKRYEFDENELSRTASPLLRLRNVLINVLVLVGGAYLGTVIWSWWPRLFIRTPWDSIILLEVNLLILSYGLRLILKDVIKLKLLLFVFPKWQYHIGLFFMSLGFFGSATSLLLLSLSTITRGFLV